MPFSIGGEVFSSFHLTGIMGSGMSAIAQYLAWSGIRVTGSDRITGEMNDCREKLEQCGCVIFPQDGSGITPATGALVASTAIEEGNADIAAARERGLRVFHRSDALAAIVESRRTVAVCGTSGKSTVTALIFEILRGAGKDPSLITGASLVRLAEEGLIGNAFKGDSGPLVIEADESDGTLVKYRPAAALFLNVSKDHHPVAQTLDMFRRLSSETPRVIRNTDDPQLDSIIAGRLYGRGGNADFRPDSVQSVTPSVRFTLRGIDFELPLPGEHNLSNALAALSLCESEGCDPESMVRPLRNFKGVARRFSVCRTATGITVIDDYAHNPEKIRAAILTAREFGGRLFAVFQPHGYGPARFLKADLVNTFSEVIRPRDELYLLPIYYAGGTVKKDISSADLAGSVRSNGVLCHAPSNRKDLLSRLKERVRPGDAVILMGARDPSLSLLAHEIENSLR